MERATWIVGMVVLLAQLATFAVDPAAAPARAVGSAAADIAVAVVLAGVVEAGLRLRGGDPDTA
jgi:phosphate/sulfate permease